MAASSINHLEIWGTLRLIANDDDDDDDDDYDDDGDHHDDNRYGNLSQATCVAEIPNYASRDSMRIYKP